MYSSRRQSVSSLPSSVFLSASVAGGGTLPIESRRGSMAASLGLLLLLLVLLLLLAPRSSEAAAVAVVVEFANARAPRIEDRQLSRSVAEFASSSSSRLPPSGPFGVIVM